MENKIVEAGLDYLTATVTMRSPNHKEFDEAAQSWFIDARECGLNVKEARNKGYDGLKLDGTFYGKRHDSYIWETSGALSNEVARFLEERQITPHITRADFQVTFEPVALLETWARDKLIEAEKRAAASGHSTKQTTGSFKNFAGDTGFTYGRRGCPSYYRCYLAGTKHKGRYSALAVRDEAEFRAARAIGTFEGYQRAEDKGMFSMGVVKAHMERHHFWEPWHDVCESVPLPTISYNASEERSMLWIENYVCPVIERLANGPYRARLVNALNRALKHKFE